MFSTQPQHNLNLNLNCSQVIYEKELVCHPSNTNTNSRVPPVVSDELLLTTTNTTIRRTTTITFTTTTTSQKEQKQQNNLKIIRLLLWCWFYKKVNGIFHKGSGPAHRPPPTQPNPFHEKNYLHAVKQILYGTGPMTLATLVPSRELTLTRRAFQNP